MTRTTPPARLGLLARALPLLLMLPLLTGCLDRNPTMIAVLAADQSQRLAQPLDVSALEDRVGVRCDGCHLKVYDAGGDAATQATQVDEAIAASADVLIIQPVSTESIKGTVDAVQRAETPVPVVAFGDLISNARRFVGFETPPVVVGAAADDLSAARAVLMRDADSMTFVPAREMSEQAADVAVGLLTETPVSGSTDFEGVGSWLYDWVDVDNTTMADVLVGRGAFTIEELCGGATARRCTRLGLQ